MTARRAWSAVFAFAVILATSACQAVVATDLRVRPDGSGVVRAGIGFDGEAGRQIADLATGVVVDDLRQAGWTVLGPQLERDLTWVRASRPFADVAEATRLLGELGPVFEGLQVRQQRSLLRTSTTFTGAVDLTAGLAAFVDADLAELTGTELLASEDARAAGAQVTVEVSLGLPGLIESNASVSGSDGLRWIATPGERVELRASGEMNRTALLLAGVASAGLVALAIAGVVLVRRLSRNR